MPIEDNPNSNRAENIAANASLDARNAALQQRIDDLPPTLKAAREAAIRLSDAKTRLSRGAL